MLKSYRRRFVLSSMVLVGLVLVPVFIALGVTQYQGVYREVRNTMRQVLLPLDEMNGSFQRIEDILKTETPPEKPDGPPPDNAAGTPPALPGKDSLPNVPEKKDGAGSGLDRDKIITVLYNSETGEISVTKNVEEISDDGRLNAAVEEILTRGEGFGRLNEYDLFYYAETVNGGSKIALADESYFTTRIFFTSAMLAVTLLVALGLFLLVSIWLSKLAAKPMENAMQMQRQFVDDVSHDLKTPITVILANNSIIKGNPEETVASQQQWLDATDDAAKGMMHMINEMLSLSSLEAPQAHVAVMPVDLTSAAQKAVLQMESVAFDRGIVMEDEIAENITALATTEYAERICNSLLENALKYEPDGGRVRVTLQTVKKHAVFTVQNFGAVISEEDLPHVFERFYRSDKARASTGGHGLGLPILKQICALIGAEITAESGENRGTIFRVSFAPGSSAAKNTQ